jgi:DNA-binding transcriptional LysR family regulator
VQLFDVLSLKLFRSVCEQKSIARAAEREATVPSAVSKRISAMEQLVGVQLLRRGPRGVEPSSAGEVLLRYASQILELMEQMQAELSGFSGDVQGSVHVIGPTSAVLRALTRDIADFLNKYNKVQVTITKRTTVETTRALEEGSTDIAVCWDQADTGRLRRLPYRYDDLALLVKVSHPLAGYCSVCLADIVEHDYVDIYPGGIISRLIYRLASDLGKTLKCRVGVNSIEDGCRMVFDGIGCTIIPKDLVALPDTVRVVPIRDSWARRDFVICAKEDDKLSLPARLLIEALSASALLDEAVEPRVEDAVSALQNPGKKDCAE